MIILGAGSIVRDTHLSACQLAKIPVAGIFDPDTEKARQLCAESNIPLITNQSDALNKTDVCFDLATPPAAHATVLEKIPHGSPVLIQKPMGSDLDEATQILNICHERRLTEALQTAIAMQDAPASQTIVNRALYGN